MRKFRNAAVAGMTAVTLVAGLNTTAFADTAEPTVNEKSQKDEVKENPASERDKFKLDKNEKNCTEAATLDLSKVQLGDSDCRTELFSKDLKDYVKNPSNSSVWGKRYDATRDVYGVDLLGQDKNFDKQPVWAQIWFVATVLGVIGTVIGIGYLPIMNQLKAMGFII